MNTNQTDRRYLAGLMLGALGVVYGDIGTSPLYALRECFSGDHGIAITRGNVLGVVSLIFWALALIVSLKYLTFVMRADNKGEGGILALLAMAFPERALHAKSASKMLLIGVFGAALLYGDGMITPAISVLSAVEGLEVATPFFKPYIIPITIVILVGLFSFQHIGTGGVGKIFGPITFIWFIALASLGIKGILLAPEVISAINPIYAIQFFLHNAREAFIVLASVFLVVTGTEALYADMGHFGVRPIRYAWFFLVFPALFLNYLGQAALILTTPAAAVNPFYNLAPKWALYPLVVLATMATIIASQALISGAFSITMQAIQLGFLPRMQIRHTSSQERGQIYMPAVNGMLMVACIGLVVFFRSSSNLAAAYGIAVVLTMLITTILFHRAARRLWNWNPWVLGLLCGLFLLIELAFCGANFLKIAHGGWFPLVVAGGIFAIMATWKTGRRILREQLQAASLPLDLFIADLDANPPTRVKGTAVFMAGNPSGTPIALLHNLKHNRVLHERVILLSITILEVPHVPPTEHVQLEVLRPDFYRVIGRYGFMDEPSVDKLLGACLPLGLDVKPLECTFFLSRESIVSGRGGGMVAWRRTLFSILSRNAQSATAFFQLPANRVVELGMQVEL
ncbi:MAG: potassium transporter Kup [Verrucomicrobiota bacterium]